MTSRNKKRKQAAAPKAGDDGEGDDDDRNSSENNNLPKRIVTIDVGGTIYRVSRSLLEQQHPDTMITRMVSETWQNNSEEVLFIERDGLRFRYVLDYMRDGKVHLPGQGEITKPSLLAELIYYGFADVDPNHIQIEFTPFEAPKYKVKLTEDFRKLKSVGWN